MERTVIFFLSLLLNYYIQAQVLFTSSNLPIVVINTNGQEIIDEPKIVADLGIIYNGLGVRNSINDPFNNYNGKISIEIRGSTSQSFSKKQYAFETQDINGENLNVSLLGMPQENDWILYAPYSDKSLIRNVLAYELSNRIKRYASRTQFCELILNDEYMGVYVLMEKIKRDNNRVDISRLDPDENSGDGITGGYIIKADKTTGSTCDGWFTDLARIYLQYHYPGCDEITAWQEYYIQTYINDLEAALFSDSFTNTNIGYRKYLDEASFIDYFIINEIANNVDGYRLSTFFYKDRDSENGKLKIGPVWDFNIAFAKVTYNNGYEIDSIQAYRYPWWKRLLADTLFTTRLFNRWKSLRLNELSNENIYVYY